MREANPCQNVCFIFFTEDAPFIKILDTSNMNFNFRLCFKKIKCTRFFISLFPAIKQFLSLFRIQPFIVARKIIKKKKKERKKKVILF